MARIMKVRTIPRGYVAMDELVPFINTKKNPAEWFMALYNKFGNPQDGGIWSYLLRHNNIVLKVTATDKDTTEYNVWVAPSFVLEAKRKRVKVVNIIARRLNEEKIVFFSEEYNDKLYYVVRRKNDELMQRSKLSKNAISDAMDDIMTDEEKKALYGGLTQYMDDVKEEIKNTINEIFDEE